MQRRTITVYPRISPICDYFIPEREYESNTLDAALDFLFTPRYVVLNKEKDNLVNKILSLIENKDCTCYCCNGNYRALNFNVLQDYNDLFHFKVGLPAKYILEAYALEDKVLQFKKDINYLRTNLRNSTKEDASYQLLNKQYPFELTNNLELQFTKHPLVIEKSINLIYEYLAYHLLQ